MAKDDLKRSFRRYRKATAFFCFIGFILSCYSLYIELAKEKDPSYKALCDISEAISCSSVLTSKYATGFGIFGTLFGDDHVLNQPNCVFGMIMYPVFVLCSLFAVPFFATLELIMGVGGVLISGYLGYVLFYILEEVCVVCIAIYAISFFLFVCSVLNYRAVRKSNATPDTDYSGYLDGKTKKRV